MTNRNSQDELLEGSLLLSTGQSLALSMPRIHWEGLKWLTEKQDENLADDIKELLTDKNRSHESDSQIAMWYVEIFLEKVFGAKEEIMDIS